MISDADVRDGMNAGVTAEDKAIGATDSDGVTAAVVGGTDGVDT